MRCAAFVAVLTAASVVSAPGVAKERVRKLVAAGVACYEALNYGCAISRLEEARDRAAARGIALDEGVGLSLCRTLAFALASVERHEQAVAAFERCFEVRPAFKLDPDVISPKIYADYEAARKKTLRQVMKGEIRPPRLPPVVPPPPARAADLEVYVPPYLTLAGMHEPDATYRHDMDFLLGTLLLFGGDGEQFDTGFSAALQYGYALTEHVVLDFLVQYSQHEYGRLDAKPDFPATLYVLQPGAGARGRFSAGEYVELSAGLLGGLSAAGLGTVGDQLGGFVAVSLDATVRPSKELGVGIRVLPTLVIAELSDGEVGTSLVLPIYLRLAVFF